MPNNNIADLLSIFEKSKIDGCDLETWKKYLSVYLEVRQTTILSLQDLIKLNKSLLSANITGFNDTKNDVELHSQIEALLADLSNMEMAVNFYISAYDEKGYLKPEYALTESQRRDMMFNNETHKIEKGSIKR